MRPSVKTGLESVEVDLRCEAKHTHVLPDVPAVEEFGEGQVGP